MKGAGAGGGHWISLQRFFSASFSFLAARVSALLPSPLPRQHNTSLLYNASTPLDSSRCISFHESVFPEIASSSSTLIFMFIPHDVCADCVFSPGSLTQDPHAEAVDTDMVRFAQPPVLFCCAVGSNNAVQTLITSIFQYQHFLRGTRNSNSQKVFRSNWGRRSALQVQQ
jgi:hypothetical protein